MRVGFIGLGQMGRGMAARLLEAGNEVAVWNRTRAAAEALGQRGARVAARAQDVLDAEVVVTMLADDAAVEAVWVAPGLIEQTPRGAVHLNMASVGVALGRRLARLHADAGLAYVAAPVFGRPESAASGQLDIIAAGAKDAVARCVPFFEVLGKRWFDVGAEPHRANVVKVARNFLLGAIVESLGEAYALADRCGVAPALFHDIITSTSMSAPAYKNYGRMILEPPAEATFPLKLGLKDIELALAAAAEAGVPMPLAALLKTQHEAAIAAGYGDREWASLGNYIAAQARGSKA